MADMELIARWKATTALLDRARHALPKPLPPHELAYASLSTQLDEYLEHNELELALDTLMELGDLTTPRGAFWRDLERAAEIMNLNNRRQAFRAAPIPPADE
ncbi:hypothetical protein ACQR1I_18200 [Bradyrhizobium sp. HKCCYLS2038]|uniref:hypothetical protein n=1 Tax=unclassified Bradyrhizobium TaxID=2631580 RepID=UPI003EB905EB